MSGDTDFASILDDGNAVASPDDVATTDPDELAPRRTRRKRSDAGQPRRSSPGRKPNSRKLVENLLEPWALIAKSLAPKAPTGAAVMIQRGEVTCTALVDIAQQHPKMLKALENLGKIGPAAVLIQSGVEILIAVQMDFGNLPVEHPMAYGLGLTQLYYQVHPDHGPAQSQGTEQRVPTHTAPPEGFIPASDPRHPMYSFQANPFGVPA